MSFLADSVMKFLGYRAMRMFTYYHVSFFFFFQGVIIHPYVMSSVVILFRQLSPLLQ